MEEKLLDMLERICEDDIVREEYDLDLIDEGLLESLAFAELLVDIEEEFGIVISPSEVGHEDMNTVNKIMAQIKQRS